MEDRLIELETKLSFQEDSLTELNEIIIKQQRQLTELGRHLAELHSQLQSLLALQDSASLADSAHDKPPHY